MRKNRLWEIKWNTLGKMKNQGSGSRPVSEEIIPVLRTYEYQGKIVKVYASRDSVDLQSDIKCSAQLTALPGLLYPQT